MTAAMLRRQWWLQQFRRWHRWIGILAAAWIVLLVSTGWLVNHAETLNLAQSEWKAPWLMEWYGMRAEAPARGFLADQHWLAGNPDAWVLDGRKLDLKGEWPIGLASTGNLLFAASGQRIRIYTLAGQLVDEMEAVSLPLSAVHRIGSAGDRVIVAGERTLQSHDGSDWQPWPGGEVNWSAVHPIPESLRQAWAPQFQPSLSVERILIDVHTGRILGRGGPWVLDAIGILLVTLAASGARLFFRRR